MRECRFCEYWTQHSIGTCSQKILTTDGNFVVPKTVGTYGCNIHSTDNSKFNTLFRMDKDEIIHISGNFSKQYLKDLIEFMEDKIKEI